MGRIPRALAAAILGALAGAAGLVAIVGWAPGVGFDMDRDLPPFVRGVYPVERAGDDTFAWTGEHAEVSLAGLDRRVPWSCVVRFRGARSSDDDQPTLVVALDGRRVAEKRATNDFDDLRLDVPPTPSKPGLVLTMTATRVFVPGPSDPRRLGVQVDRFACAPVSGIVLPPRRALGAAAASAAVLGAGFALIGVTAGSAIGGGALMAAGQAVVLARGAGVFGAYPPAAVTLALALTMPVLVLVWLVERRHREPLRNTARFVATCSIGVLYLQLLALLHPSKGLVDALFHAHRFDAVLAGRWYFTQLSTSGTPFPYAIGLYLFAAPWATLTTNHVALLRIVVSASIGLAGALLYPLVIRTWGNRTTAAIAVALFSLVPVSYVIVGNANLTNAFGQAVSTVTVVVLATVAERLRRVGPFLGVAALATLGLMCHISSLVLLTATLLTVAAMFWWGGGRSLRPAAGATLLVTVVALAASAGIYWGHFGDVYRVQVERARMAVSSRATPAEGRPAAGVERAVPGKASDAPSLGHSTLPLSARVTQALAQTLDNIGWPIVLLGLVGLWRWAVEGGRSRLDLTIAAWGLVWAVFLVAAVVSPGNKAYQQDAWEFIGRVEHATMPAAVLLAARGTTWLWNRGPATRAASLVLLLAAVSAGVSAWASWLS